MSNWISDLLKWLRQERILEDAEVRRDLKRWVPEYAPAAPVVLRVVDASGAEARR